MHAMCLYMATLAVLAPLLLQNRGVDGFVGARSLEPISTMSELEQTLPSAFHNLGVSARVCAAVACPLCAHGIQ